MGRGPFAQDHALDDALARPEFLAMLPYLGVIVAMVLLAGRTRLPAALATPYRRGAR